MQAGADRIACRMKREKQKQPICSTLTLSGNMKISFFFLAVLFSLGFLNGRSKVHEPVPDRITVYVFLHDACLISQYYTVALRELHAEYATEDLHFVGLFPSF